MTSIVCYLDLMSPQAGLAFERLPEALLGISYSVRYKPVLLASLLKQQDLLRLAVACDEAGMPNRYVCETIFRYVLACGDEASDTTRLVALSGQLAPVQDEASDRVNEQLKAHSAEAMAMGVFDGSTFVVDGQVFRGVESLPVLRNYLLGKACVRP
jgi:2-hydroxychromene-2-carboxylate isomerase